MDNLTKPHTQICIACGAPYLFCLACASSSGIWPCLLLPAEHLAVSMESIAVFVVHSQLSPKTLSKNAASKISFLFWKSCPAQSRALQWNRCRARPPNVCQRSYGCKLRPEFAAQSKPNTIFTIRWCRCTEKLRSEYKPATYFKTILLMSLRWSEPAFAENKTDVLETQ